MANNLGKDFETIVKKGFEKINGCSIDRVHDQTTGFKGSANICDFTVYKYPFFMYLECKTTHEKSLRLENISRNQWNGLLNKSRYSGVICGVLVWFIALDETVFIPINTLDEARANGVKSINIRYMEEKHLKFYYVGGKKKRVFFNYDFKDLLTRLFMDKVGEMNDRI